MAAHRNSSILDRALLNAAVAECAHLFGAAFDRLTPAELDQAAQEQRPLLVQAVEQAPKGTLERVRNVFGRLAADMRREHHDPAGRSLGHPYMWVLQEDALSRDRGAHVQVILQHLDWYRQQMDAALARVFGS